jgi:DNA-binding NarL/FixJ family response regulator
MTKQTDSDAITILIVDDHRSFGEALQVALDKESDLTVVEVVTDGPAAVETTAARQPDIVLMDLSMPGVDGIEATKRIRERSVGTAVIILSGADDDLSLARAVQAGARGFVPKTGAILQLADAIRRAHRGEPLHKSDEVAASARRLKRRRAIDGNLQERVERLTPREVEVLQQLADGATPDEISKTLEMSKHTLRTHTQNVLTKLNVHTKLDAIVVALRYGKIRTPEVATQEDETETTSL